MIYFWIILALVLCILAVVLFAETRLIIEYRDKELKLKVRNAFLRLTLDSKTVSKLRGKEQGEKKKDESPSKGVFEKISDLKEKYNSVKETIDVFAEFTKHRISISKVKVYITYGTGDACTTGMAYGAIWALIGNIYSYVCRHFYITFPEVKLNAQFDGKPTFEAECEGIIKLRFVHIIIAAIRSYKSYKKHKK